MESILTTKDGCRKILKHMRDIIKNYDKVTVADYKDMIGEEPVYSDYYTGWYYLDTAQIRKTKDSKHHRIIFKDPVDLTSIAL